MRTSEVCLDLAQVRDLARILARAFTRPFLLEYASGLAELAFAIILTYAQVNGAVVYIPARAVAIMKPPRDPARALAQSAEIARMRVYLPERWRWALWVAALVLPLSFATPVGRLRGRCWLLTNGATWPRRTGAGTAALLQICGLADVNGYRLCLVASNDDNRRLYARAGFMTVGRPWVRPGVIMVREPSHPAPLNIADEHRVIVVGRQASRMSPPHHDRRLVRPET